MSAPGPDMKEMLEQAQRMQSRIAELQQELSTRRFEASSGGGMVTAAVTGQLRVLEIRIEPSLFSESDRGMIEDLAAAAEVIQHEAPAPEAPPDVVLDRLRVFAQKENRGLFASLSEARLIERENGFLKLEVSAPFHRKRLQDNLAEFERICQRFFSRPTRIEINEAKTPHSRDGQKSGTSSQSKREAERQRRQTALNHPKINVALEALKAEIVDIRPIGGK